MAERGELTRRAILDAAIERFGREGFRATSVADIARDAGVGSTLTYAYFPNKSALFYAALDEDAAAIIEEGLVGLADVMESDVHGWRQHLFLTLVTGLDRHPLARRVLAGLEPDTTDRVLAIGALNELRKACAERIRSEQERGHVRDDIDPVSMGNGFITITLALLMGVIQVGGSAAIDYGPDVAGVFEAALLAPATRASRRARG